ncbi:replication protein [Neobacillus drentensis]|uniref:replication protein n=1 Tax=Neobacillus drentensis TaxID=220684 RepID=UPI002FFFF574
MADVQLENGYTQMANEILEQMARIKLSATQYRLLFVIWRYTYGFKRKGHHLSLKFLSQATGCDHRQIQRELKSLEERKVIIQDIKSGSYRKISFNKNHDAWIGKAAIDKTAIGEIDIGEIDSGNIGENVKASLGETDNQERKKENIKETNNEHMDQPNPTKEFEKYFGLHQSGVFSNQIKEWVENSLFQEPEAIICEVINRAKLNSPKQPVKYIQSILVSLHNLGLFTLTAVQDYNAKFDQKVKHVNKSPQQISLKRPDHWKEPEPLTNEDLFKLRELEAEMPY